MADFYILKPIFIGANPFQGKLHKLQLKRPLQNDRQDHVDWHPCHFMIFLLSFQHETTVARFYDGVWSVPWEWRGKGYEKGTHIIRYNFFSAKHR